MPRRPPASGGPGRRLPLLLGLMVLLLGAAVWVNAGRFQAWQYSREPLDRLAANARHDSGNVLLATTAVRRLLDAGRAAEAAELLGPLRSAQPSDPEVTLLAGRTALLQGDMTAAGTLFNEVLQAYPQNPGARFWMGEFLLRRGYQQRAEELFVDTTRLAPRNAAAWVRLGEIALDNREFAAALEDARRAKRTSGGPEAALLEARALKELGRVPEAEQAARTTVQRAPQSAEAHVVLGEVLRLSPGVARAREAEAAFRRALELDPQSSSALKDLAIVHRSLGEHAEAVRLLRRLLRLQPAAPDPYQLLGQSYVALKKPDLARRCFDAYRMLHDVELKVGAASTRASVAKGSLPAQLDLARTYLEVGQLSEARRVLESVRDRMGDRPELRALAAKAAGPDRFQPPALPPDPEGDAS